MADAHTSSKGTTSYLHGRVTTLRNGREQPMCSFAKSAGPTHAVDHLPAGYVVG